MRFARLTTLAAFGASLLLAGCSGSSSRIPAAGLMQSTALHRQLLIAARPGIPMSQADTSLQSEHPPCGTSIMFVSEVNNNFVAMFSGGVRCGSIKNVQGPQGITTDAQGNLWVVQSSAGTVTEYKPPYTGKPARTLHDQTQEPVGVAICKGYIAVTNITSNTVEIYAGAANRPTSKLSDPNAQSEYFAACDPSGNLFTTYSHGLSGGVNEFVGGQGSAVELSTLGFPGGIAYRGTHLFVLDQDAETIAKFASPYTQPAKTITLSGASDPVTFGISPSGTQFLTADASLKDGELYSATGNNTGNLGLDVIVIGAAYNKL